MDNDPGALYQLCVNPECEFDFAYRFDATPAPHYHYVGPPRTVEEAQDD